MDLFKLVGTIAIDNSEANNKITDTSSKADKAGSKIQAAFSKIGTVLANAFKSEKPKEFANSLKAVTGAVDKQETELNSLKKEYEDLYLKFGKNSKEAKECAGKIEKLSSELKENKTKLKDAESAADKFDKSLDEVGDSASKAGDGISGTFKSIGTAVATFFAVDKITEFGMGCINAAADANAANSQFAQVFGELESQAKSSLSGIAKETGIVETRMKGSYTQIAAFAKTSGMDTEAALSLSNRAMVAVADSAAFYDRSLEETTESLQSFLKGNFENDAALGLSCTETTRNAAANKLYGKSFNDLSESQKQLTLLQMVEDANKLSGAMGQASRESDTWSNQTGNLKQAWENFKATIGENFLDIAVNAVKSLAEKVTSLTEKVPEAVKWFKDLGTWCSENQGLLITIASAIGVVTAAVTAYNVVGAIQAAVNAAEAGSLAGLIAMKLASAAATMAALIC